MNAKCIYAVGLVVVLFVSSSAFAGEVVHYDVVDKIMEEAFENSQVMDTASWVIDVFGPRNSKSSGYVQATEWAKKRLEEYGLSNARLEPFEFGIGWENEFSSMHMMSPQYMPIIGYPAAWSSGTDGKILAKVKYINTRKIASKEDLEQYRGKVKDFIIFTHPVQKIAPHFEPMVVPYTDAELDKMAKYPIKEEERRGRRGERDEKLSDVEIFDFLVAEGAAAIARTDGANDFGAVDGAINGYAMDKRLWEAGADDPINEIILAAEHYNRIMRILEKGIDVEMEVEIKARIIKEPKSDYNVVAEIPGTDLADEIVVIGAHIQSEPIGAGAADDGAGVAVCMETVRIFQELGIKPRRTIRIGLWGGHEMGLYGNRSHVRKNFADLEKKEYKDDYHNVCAYFNLDAGGGRIKALSIMGNEEVRAIFSEWMKPLHNLGFKHLLTTGMAHEAYQEVGLPGYYFMQDRRDPRQYHSNMDLYDRLVPEDMMANTVIFATFVYHAAMRDEKLPRIAPLPW